MQPIEFKFSEQEQQHLAQLRQQFKQVTHLKIKHTLPYSLHLSAKPQSPEKNT